MPRLSKNLVLKELQKFRVTKLLTALLASLMIAGMLAGLDLTNSPIHANMNQMEKR